MRWKIKGADAASGKDVELTLSAGSRAAAEAEAHQRGCLVEVLDPIEDDGEVPAVTSPIVKAKPSYSTPDEAYPDVRDGARVVGGVGVFLIAAGILLAVAGLLGLFSLFAAPSVGADYQALPRDPWAGPLGVSEIVGGFWSIAAGFLLRLVAGCARAIRDIAVSVRRAQG